jgi:hypothetical protein
MTQIEKIATVEKDLATFKSDADKRRYLLFTLKKIIQDAIKNGDPFEGTTTQFYKYVLTELRFMKANKN